ncbi:MAG: GTP pyrophosphokinase family protein [Clostridia bacterium]|nr:GTP pyrophosphokinase family protein [Clostridia bacterium]
MKLKTKLSTEYSYDIINNISKRIKTKESIINKLEKKHYEVNLRNIIENINDVAGLRITCPVKNDIYTVIDIIEKLSNIEILEKKDYLTKPKKSGYSGYHIIVQTPVEIEGKEVHIKVEIQIRTMAMDFWATNEHKVRYKSNKKLSLIDSKKLTAYAKLINIIDDKIMEIYHKQELA